MAMCRLTICSFCAEVAPVAQRPLIAGSSSRLLTSSSVAIRLHTIPKDERDRSFTTTVRTSSHTHYDSVDTFIRAGNLLCVVPP